MILLLLNLRGSRHTATPTPAEGTTGIELVGTTEGVAAERPSSVSQSEARQGLKTLLREGQTERERGLEALR